MQELLLVSLNQHNYTNKTILLQFSDEHHDKAVDAVRDLLILSDLCDRSIVLQTDGQRRVALAEYKTARSHFLTKYNLPDTVLEQECGDILVRMLMGLNINVKPLQFAKTHLPLHILDSASGAKSKLIDLGNGVMLDSSKWIVPDKKHD